ncbi:MAG: hypothetical protein HYT50_00645 [Candidatus Wildermuthbacteria bacterium]|nr:hypothetical protein [Candidatus Wildermuthbacteria bacterium]
MKLPFSFSIPRIKPAVFQKRVLVLDVGDVYLKFAYCTKNENGWNASLQGKEQTNTIFWHKSLESAWNAIKQSHGGMSLEKDAPKTVINLSPSIFKARSKDFFFSRKEAKAPFSEYVERELVRMMKDMLLTSAPQEFSQSSGIQKGEFLMQDMHALQWYIDGYEVPRVQGFQGKEVKCSVLATFLLRSWKEALEAFRKSHTSKEFVLLHEAQALQKFALAKNMSGTFVNIGDLLTHAVGIKEGNVLFVKEFPVGGDRFTYLVEQMLGMNAATAREFKETYSKGKVSEAMKKRVQDLFLPEASRIGIMIQESLQPYPALMLDPVYVFGGGAQVPDIAKAISQEKEVRLLLPQDIMPLSGVKESDPQYTSLVLQLHGVS